MSVLAVDIGASHVDLAWHDGRSVALVKHPRGGQGLAASVLAAVDACGRDPAGLAALRLATTLPLNALLGGKRARVALVTSQGFADVLALGRQNRADLHDPVARHPLAVLGAPLVAPGDVHCLTARADARGSVVAPVDPAALSALVAGLRADPPDAVAVSLVFGHLAPGLEHAVAEALRAALPGVPVACGHQVDPQPREFERTLATVIEAALAPLLQGTLARVMAGLAERGAHPRLLLADGAGALRPAEAMEGRLSALLEGGPAAAAALAARHLPQGAGLVLDMGAASMDLVLVQAGRPVLARYRTLAGLPLRRVGVDGESIALGGASVLAGGMRLDAVFAAVEAGEAGAAVRAAALDRAARAVAAFCTARASLPIRNATTRPKSTTASPRPRPPTCCAPSSPSVALPTDEAFAPTMRTRQEHALGGGAVLR